MGIKGLLRVKIRKYKEQKAERDKFREEMRSEYRKSYHAGLRSAVSSEARRKAREDIRRRMAIKKPTKTERATGVADFIFGYGPKRTVPRTYSNPFGPYGFPVVETTKYKRKKKRRKK